MATIKEVLTGLNLRAGFIRLWIFGAVIWAGWVLSTWPNKDGDLFGPYIETDGAFTRSLPPEWKAENENLFESIRFETRFPMPWRRAETLWLTPEEAESCNQKKLNEKSLCRKFFEEFEVRDKFRRGEYFKRAVPYAFGPPALVAFLLFGLGWVISGFSRSASPESLPPT